MPYALLSYFSVQLPLTFIFLSAAPAGVKLLFMKEDSRCTFSGLETMHSLEILASYWQQKSHEIVSTLENPSAKRHIRSSAFVPECHTSPLFPYVLTPCLIFQPPLVLLDCLLLWIMIYVACNLSFPLFIDFLASVCKRTQIKNNLFLDLSKCDLTHPLYSPASEKE